MDKDTEDIELIERFLKGELTHAEAVDFETRVDEDHEFARKLRLRKTFPSLFNAKGQDAIVMEVDAEPEEPEEPRPEKKGSKPAGRRILIVIAGIMLLAVIIFLVVQLILPWRDLLKNAVPSGSFSAKPSVVKKPGALKSVTPSSAVNKPSEAQIPSAQNPVPAQAVRTDSPLKPAAPPQPVELLLPIDNEVVGRGQDVVFRWKMQTDTFTNFYLISLANNKLAWWRGIKPGVRELTLPAINFKAGKFYWYVGSKEFKRILIVADI